MGMWIVMTSSAKMPNSCRGTYRNVAIVELTQKWTAHFLELGLPKMISTRAQGVHRVRHLGHFNVGSTDRCAYKRALADAERLAYALNNTPCVEDNDAILMSWGGSA